MGEAAAAGPATAQAGSAASTILLAVARAAGDGAAAAQAAALAARLDRLAVENARALDAARCLLPGDDDGAADDRRDFALGRALDAAAAVPLAIAEACADVAGLAETLAGAADARTAPDVEAARLLAVGAARAAAHLVEVNLAVAPGDERLARARAAAAVGDP